MGRSAMAPLKPEETAGCQRQYILRARKVRSPVSAACQGLSVGGRLTACDGEAPLENGWVSVYPCQRGFPEYWRIQ
jgi:hypothetical protein